MHSIVLSKLTILYFLFFDVHCSRFHLLSDFDDLKRTCRQGLSQHNCRQRRLRMLRKAAQNDYSIQMAHMELSASLPVSTEWLQQAAPSTIIFLNRPQAVLNLSESAGLNFLQSPELNNVCFPLAQSSGGCIPSQPEGPTNSMRFVAVQATPTTLYQAQLEKNGLDNSAGQLQTAAKEPMELEEFIWLEQCLAKSLVGTMPCKSSCPRQHRELRSAPYGLFP